jgi:uncharacterized integral membrane protein
MARGEVEAAPSKRDRGRQIAMIAFGGLAVLFALLNLDEVKVNWLLGTWQTPLIIVIAVAFLLGALAGWLGARRRA